MARILLVEDEETLRESLKRVLIREGYAVEGVDSSESALKSIEICGFDIIIADIILPGISGLELLKKCKTGNSDLIVIIMTAYATIESAVEAVKNGAYDFIVKPVIHEDLKTLLKKALAEKALS